MTYFVRVFDKNTTRLFEANWSFVPVAGMFIYTKAFGREREIDRVVLNPSGDSRVEIDVVLKD